MINTTEAHTEVQPEVYTGTPNLEEIVKKVVVKFCQKLPKSFTRIDCINVFGKNFRVNCWSKTDDMVPNYKIVYSFFIKNPEKYSVYEQMEEAMEEFGRI